MNNNKDCRVGQLTNHHHDTYTHHYHHEQEKGVDAAISVGRGSVRKDLRAPGCPQWPQV